MPNIGGNTAQLLDELRRSNSSRQTTVENNIPAHLAPFKSTITGKTSEGVQVVRPVKYDVPVNAIYDRLSTGNRIARFENYIGATGNEERLAQGQSATEKVWNGLAKNSMKTLNYALDSVVGTGYGLVSALSSGELVDLYDNDFGNAMDDFNKKLDYQLPNYYTEEEKSMNFLQKMGTANFLANDVANAVAFVGGALIPSAIMTAVTGGAGAVSFGTGLSKGLAKLGLKTAGKAATSLADDAVRATINSVDDIAEASASLSRIGRYTAEGEEGMTWLKSMARTAYTKKGGDILSTAGFLARSSSFEAGMEARQALKTSMDNFMSTFEEKNGRPASYEDVKKFTEDATKAANSLYGANMAILSVSNSIMFGKTLGAIGPNTTKVFNNVGNRLIGLGTKAGEEAGTIALRTASKGQKVLGNTYKILGKPISEGVYEEGFQGVASKTMESYLDHKYDPKHIGGYDMWSEVTDAFSKQYGTKEGWTEMGIGMLIGGFGGVFQKQGIVGLGKNSWKNSRTELENQVTEANKGVEKIKGLNRASSAQAFGQMAANKEATSNNFEIANPSIANTVANTEFIKSQMSVKSPKEIKADFEAVVDNMQLSESDLQAIGGENNIEAYKQGLKDDFNQTSKDLMEANKIVDALGLNRTLKDTPGNLSQIGDAVAMSFVLGKQGLYNAQEIGKQIDSMVGTDGIFDSLQHYNNLSADNQQKIQDLQDKKDEYKALNDTAVKLGQQLAEQNQLKGETEGVVENARYKSMSEKMVLTQKRMNQLNSEIGVLEQAIGKSFDGQNFNILGAQEQTTQTGDIFQSLEQLSKLDSFRESLELSGKTQAVDTLNTLVSRYKEFSNAHREMNNTIRNMMDTNFFSSKEGKGLLDRVKGKNYQMDDSFKKLIKENNDYLVNNFYNAGISTEDVESVIKASLEDNENLSDREKYRLESIVRLMLSQQQSQRTLNALATPEVVETVNPISPEDALAGDTIELAEQIDFKENGLTPIDQLKKAISIITKQLDGIVNTSRDNQGEIDKLQKQLQTLKNKRDAVKGDEKQEQEGDKQGNITEYTNVGGGQQVEVTGQETTNEADNSDSNIPSQTQEEVEAQKADIERRRQEELTNNEKFSLNGKQGINRDISFLNLFDREALNLPEDDNIKTIIHLEDKYENGIKIAEFRIITNYGAETFTAQYDNDKINAKYDAELAALENKETQEEIGNISDKDSVILTPKYFKDLIEVNKKLFGLDDTKAKAAAVIMDRMVANMAYRANVTKSDMYKKLQFEKTSEQFIQELSKKSKVLWQLVGENAQLKQKIKENLQVAKNMEALKKDAKNIRLATGWEKGKDDKWRYEILDGSLKIKPSSFTGTLLDVLENEDLFKAYPELANIKVKIRLNGFGTGSFNSRRGIEINGGTKDMFSILIHEVQHAIQSIEGFARGGNPFEFSIVNEEIQNLASPLTLPKLSKEDRSTAKEKTKVAGLRFSESFFFDVKSEDIDELEDVIERLKIINSVSPNDKYATLINALEDKIDYIQSEGSASFNKYFKLAGEAEARNVQKRADMTSEQRAQQTLQETEDVAREEQIILFQKDGNIAHGAMRIALDGQVVIYALTDPNVSTPLHEFAHVFEQYLTKYEKQDILKWSGQTEWNTDTSEKFARGFEKYLAEGIAPIPSLQNIFGKFKTWLLSIYDGLIKNDIAIDINDSMRELYSKMLNQTQQTQEEIISDEVYKEFVDNGNVSVEVLQSLVDKVQNNEQLSERELAIFMDKVSEINKMLVEANKQTTTEGVDTVSRNLNEIDNLIDQRVKNYGLTPVDILEDISETDSNIIDRAKAGEVVDINALQGVIDYLYSKYKEVVALKNDDAARTEKGLKTQYLLDVQAILEEDLDYLVDYVNKIKSGESVQQGANKTGTETNVSSTTTQTTNEVIATPITGATTDIGINQKDVAIDILNLEEQIAQIEAKINELSLPFRIIDTKEYTRYSELLKKKDSGKQLEESEVKELEQLRSDIDQWLLVTGTVVDGLRLSDLVRQQSAIANTPIATVEDITEMTTKEVMEQISFEDVARGKYNSSIAQSYDAAMVSVDSRGNVVVSNVTEEGLRELTPVDFVTENDKYPEDVQDRGNTILSLETVKAINSNPDSKITIRPTNKDTNSTYSYVVEFKQDMAGNETANPLKTDFDDLNGSMETDSIYDVEPGDAISLRIDPQDGFNKNLLAKYKNAKTKKDKQKVLDEMAKTLVVRIYHNGLFKGVLKAKNNRVKALDKSDDKFEVMRDMIVNRPGFLAAMDSGTEFMLDEFDVTAKQVLPGHPFLNMTRDIDGNVTVDYKEISEQEAKNISDIGYVENGRITTRNQMTGIDTTFLNTAIKNNGKNKTPFIVVKKGGKLIAYPVKVKTTRVADIQSFEKIFKDSSAGASQRIVNLNKFLAEDGINIKEQGKAFLPTNLTQEFFDKMKTELKGKQYFYNLNEWMNLENNLNDILTQQILINLNVSQGFHSPKIKLDFSKVYEEITLPDMTQEETEEAVKNAGKISSATQRLAALRGKQETNTDC